MPINFPTSLDSFANPTSGSYEDDVGLEHHIQHANANDAAEVLEAKVGIGASTPTAGKVLGADGTGTSSWRQVATGDITPGAVSQSANAAPTASQTTTSTTPVDMTGATVTFTTTGGRVLLLFAGYAGNSGANGYTALTLVQDGGSLGELAVVTSATAAAFCNVGMSTVSTPAAGSHTWKIQWRVSGGTSTLYSGNLSVVEIKK
jgi:hypothetical protein